MEPSKSAFLSKTLWLNAIMAILAIALPSFVTWTQANAETYAQIVAIVFMGVNFLLRWITKGKIQLY